MPISPTINNLNRANVVRTAINGGNWNCEVHPIAGGFEGTVYVRTLSGGLLYSRTLTGDAVEPLLLALSAIGMSGA